MKPTICLLALVTLLLLPASARAQQWSDQEQEVLDQLAECWDIWMEGVASGTPDRWLSECTTPEATYWGGENGAPHRNEYVRRIWGMVMERDRGWVDIRPVALTIVDDIAVLHHYGYWRAATDDGETVTEARRTEVFRRIDGRWKIVTIHGTPVTPEDAEPYRRGRVE